MALVTKILEQTLTAGQTSVVFTDTDIPNSLIRVFSSNSDIIPVSRILSGNSLTVTYEAQTVNMDVALEIAKQGLEIVDNVTSSDTDKALSAKQGKVLKDAIDSIVIPTVPENITDLDDVNVTSIQDGQILAWDSIEEKFKNVNQSSGGGIDYSTDEQNTGIKWLDGKYIYQKSVTTPAINISANSSIALTLSSLDISDYDTIVDVSGLDETLNIVMPYLAWSNGNIYAVTVAFDGNNSIIFSRSGGAINSQIFKLTIQYTKN